MPVMDGLEATKIIRQMFAEYMEKPEHKFRQLDVRRTPIVALTADGNFMRRDQVFSSGMDEFLEKPCDFKQLK